MGRPQKARDVQEPPRVQSFKPAGIPRTMLEQVSLGLGEFEAIRLADYEGLDHKDAAVKMGVSRPTFTRMIEKARNKVARALVEGCELEIEGGNIHFRNNVFKCGKCGELIRFALDSQPQKCPKCESVNFIDLAESFGHGPCCRRRWRGGR